VRVKSNILEGGVVGIATAQTASLSISFGLIIAGFGPESTHPSMLNKKTRNDAGFF
jgi:hypothetical protein